MNATTRLLNLDDRDKNRSHNEINIRTESQAKHRFSNYPTNGIE